MKPMLIILSIFLDLTSATDSTLDGFVKFYELTRQNVPIRHKRDTEELIRLPVTLFNRTLTLLLQNEPKHGTFDDNHQLDMSGLSSDFQSIFVNGHVEGYENSSLVFGSLIDDSFQGEIRLSGETYFLEDAKRFQSKLGGLSVAYRLSDIAIQPNACGWVKPDMEHEQPVFRYAREAKSSNANQLLSFKQKPKVCGLYVQIDYLLYREYLNDADNNEEMAVKQLMAMIHYKVKTVNDIFAATEFVSSAKDGTTLGPFSNIQISISRTKIYKTAEEFANHIGVSVAELNQSMDAVTFLNLISGVNNDLYCASYVFTYRYFDGVLGLAWVFSGNPSFISAGICARYAKTNVRPYRRTQNTGIVTLVNYGQRISLAVGAVTFAHELGHNFGADHDNRDGFDANCAPGGYNGNYIMFASATTGDKPNNRRFSDCSRHAIARTLDVLMRNPDALTCMKDVAHFCGNGIVDPGEECDCGFRDECQADAKCCGPADDPNPNARCRLRRTSASGSKVQCSASNGECCDVATCSFIPAASQSICRHEDQCRSAAICNGTSAECPDGLARPDGTFCNDMTRICKAGECVSSMCELISDGKDNFTSCQVERPEGQTRYNRSELCYLACRSSKTEKCLNSAHLNSDDFSEDFRSFLDKFNRGNPIQLKAGAPCDNDRGYCDVFQRCRPINAEGPLARLTILLLSEQTANTIRSWAERYWWMVALIAIAMIAFSIGFVKICSVHTKSDNRALPPARSLSDTLRRVKLRIATSPSANNRRSFEPRSSTELNQFLSHDCPSEDDQVPNAQRAINEDNSTHGQPLVRNIRRAASTRGHVRSQQTRIVHSEYQSYRRSAVAVSLLARPQTIAECVDDEG